MSMYLMKELLSESDKRFVFIGRTLSYDVKNMILQSSFKVSIKNVSLSFIHQIFTYQKYINNIKRINNEIIFPKFIDSYKTNKTYLVLMEYLIDDWIYLFDYSNKRRKEKGNKNIFRSF